jgi:NAD(P) transhydrogenase subunit alpha
VPNEVINYDGVHIVGYCDLASRLAHTSSQLYGTNLYHLLEDMGGGKNFRIDFDDVVIRSATVVKEGEITWPPPPVSVTAAPKKDETAVEAAKAPVVAETSATMTWIMLAAAVLALVGVAMTGDQGFITDVTVFVLACIVGWQVIWNVSASLHTPLMSVTNAISGIILVGGMIQVGAENSVAAMCGAIAIFFASINIAGGFSVTHRMLKMFRK